MNFISQLGARRCPQRPSRRVRRPRRGGFVMMEVLMAVAFFGIAGTSMMVALNQLGKLSGDLARDRRLARILDSELRRAMSIPNLEEGTTTRQVEELDVELETLIEAIPEMENQDGQVLSNMFRIQVSANWWADGEWQNESTETWRYARLYRQ